MSEKPILFSAAMVRAILSGSKTQTRRAMKLPTKSDSGGPIYEHPRMGGWAATTFGGGGCFTFGRGGERIPTPETVGIWHQTCGVAIAARWQAGDRLWVREALTARPLPNFLTGEPTNAIVAAYAADDEDVVEQAGFNLCPWWKGGEDKRRGLPSIHMPRWASRITLEVTGIKVERLQDISEADAIAEGLLSQQGDDDMAGAGYKWTGLGYHGGTFDKHGGATFHVPNHDGQCSCRVGGATPAQCAYRDLWTHINGPGAWEANPFVVAISFRRVEDTHE